MAHEGEHRAAHARGDVKELPMRCKGAPHVTIRSAYRSSPCDDQVGI
jgi:hypothetical protein